jgi:hypothetical protein
MKCRNYYVNKYLRDYSKNADGLSKEVSEKYESNPKYCLKCGEKIPYEKRRNNYCGHSCKASALNIGRTYSDETIAKMSNSRLRNVEYKVKKCKGCSNNIINSRLMYCSDVCKKEYKRKHMDEFLIYKADAKFNFTLNDYPDEFNFKLIEEYGWYAPSNSSKPNIGGVSRDHMYSINEGFKNGVDPKLISHPANCQLMIHNDNISKNKKSSLTLEELIIRINDWDLKYKK